MPGLWPGASSSRTPVDDRLVAIGGLDDAAVLEIEECPGAGLAVGAGAHGLELGAWHQVAGVRERR